MIVVEPDLISNPKQNQAMRYLLDRITTELLFGGAAGGGKTKLGCMWLIIMCLKFPLTRWLLGRAILKTLKETSLNTFFETCSEWGIKPDVHFQYNTKDNLITFKKELGGSQILLKDLFAYPSDPEFDSLGSLEITGAFIDEVSQVTEKAKNIVNSRIRYKLKDYDISGEATKDMKILEYDEHGKPCKWETSKGEITTGLVPKLLMSCNPAKNWVYNVFYKPSVQGVLPYYRKFIPALPNENPFISSHYLDNLDKLDNISKQRLKYGNWEYDDDPAALMTYESIIGIFDRPLPSGKKYITCDVARLGQDKTIIMVWDGWRVIEIIEKEKSTIPQVVLLIKEVAERHKIGMKNVICDEDGVGGGVVDYLRCQGFVNNSTPLKEQHKDKVRKVNYANLRSQCYFILGRKVNMGEISVETDNIDIKHRMIEDLEQIKQKDIDKDGKLAIIGRQDIIAAIGRSPDYGTTLMERVWFDLKKRNRFRY